MWALFLVYGLFFGLTEGPEKALVARLAPAGLRGSAFGAYHAAIGLAALPASIMFGIVWQAFSSQAAFGMGAAHRPRRRAAAPPRAAVSIGKSAERPVTS